MMPGIATSLAVLLSLILIKHANGVPRVDPLVNTDLGLIRGVRASDGDYSMFMGIPFGKVNASNPFGAAIPQVPFEDVFDADDDSAICPQIEEFSSTVTGGLDCLHLNIYVPTSANSRNILPVLVWIYGGGFSIGFGGRLLYGPKFFVKHDVILVTVNYRIGPYGFMCLDTPEQPGNEGFKDQLLALRWIKNNIGSFGGDPNKVTLFGESAGGIAVDFHVLSPQEKLYDKIIIQSGTSLSPVFYEPHKDGPLLLARHLGLYTNDMNEALRFLANTETDLVIAATSELKLDFRPCVEKPFEGVENLITENWIHAQMPKIKDVPVLIGFNDHERLLIYLNNSPESFENLDIFHNKLNLGFHIDSPDFQGMQEAVHRFYMGDEAISFNTRFEIIDFDSDYMYSHPTYRSIGRYLNNDASDIFLYVFSYTGGRNFVKRRLNVTEGGAAHADEIGYLFDISFFDEEPTPKDQLVIDRMTTMWTNFVKFGNPTPEINNLLPVVWPPITKSSLFHYIDIGADLKVDTRPFYSRMSFWDLFYRTNENLQKNYPGSEL